MRRRKTFQRSIIGWVCVAAVSVAAWAGSMPHLKIDPTPIPDSQVLRSTFAAAIEKAAPSVVYVYTTKRIKIRQIEPFPFFDDPFLRRFFGLPPSGPIEREEHGLGSGVIVSEDGYILTNNHVVENADEIEVRVGEKRYKAKVVGTDPPTDVAVLKIKATGLPAITITDSDHLKVGDIVLAIGNPFGVGKTVTMGIVSALGRTSLGITQYENFIQTDAAINPGNSGGALIDVKGRLVGINTAIFTRTGEYAGIGFAIPINLARSVMESLIKYGKVNRGYLGVYIQPLTEDLAKAFGIKETKGAVIAEVVQGTPAAKAGLKPGDVIVAINGQPVQDAAHLRIKVAETPPGTKVRLTIIRNGKKRDVEVTLGALKQGGLASQGQPSVGAGSDLLDGVVVDDLTVQNRREYRIPATVQGALVVEVSPDCLAYKAGLRPGDVILEINHKRVRNAQEAVDAAQQIQGNMVLLRVWSRGVTHFIVIRSEQ